MHTKQEAFDFVRQMASYKSQRAAAHGMGRAQSRISDKYKAARDILGESLGVELYDAVRAGDEEAVRKIAQLIGYDENLLGMTAEDVPAIPASRPKATEVVGLLLSKDPLQMELMRLQEENRALSSGIGSLRKQLLTDERVKSEIYKLANYTPEPPEWLVDANTATGGSPGVPTLLASDWHWGEVVRPSEINYVNEYNMEIAQKRSHKLIETTITLLTQHLAYPRYPGIVFALAGDMLTGNIHEELSETNDMPINLVFMDLVDNLMAAILRLKAVFKKVFIPCVAGNHGRTTKKVRAKEFNYNNYDWLLYQTLARAFRDDPDVKFYIPDGTSALVNVANRVYNITHGNMFRGGDGMIGHLGPITRGDHKMRTRSNQIHQGYDTLVMGHFHQLLQSNDIITNGSLIGYNEYAWNNNFRFEVPAQALWITHPQVGITIQMPVYLEDKPQKNEVEGSWVSHFASEMRSPQYPAQHHGRLH